MFIVHLPGTIRIGGRATVTINGAPATVYWRDERTLVINDTDPRAIVIIERGGVDGDGQPIATFTCGDQVSPETAF